METDEEGCTHGETEAGDCTYESSVTAVTERDADVTGAPDFFDFVSRQAGQGHLPADRLAPHPEAAGLAPFPLVRPRTLADRFSLLLALQEVPELFENIWRSVGPPDVGSLTLVVRRPPRSFVEGHSMQQQLVEAVPMNRRNWIKLKDNFEHIYGRLRGNIRFWDIFEESDDDASSGDRRLFDPVAFGIVRQRRVLIHLIPSFEALSVQSYDTVERQLRNFLRQLRILEHLLQNNLFAHASRNLREETLHQMAYPFNPLILTGEVHSVIGTLARYNMRLTMDPPYPQSLLDFDRAQFAESDIGYYLLPWRVAFSRDGHRFDRRASLWETTVMGDQMNWGHPDAMVTAFGREELDTFLERARLHQSTLDNDVSGLGGIAEQFERTVLNRFMQMREERGQAFRGMSSQYARPYDRGYVANVLPAVCRTFDQVSRGFPLSHAWTVGRPLYGDGYGDGGNPPSPTGTADYADASDVDEVPVPPPDDVPSPTPTDGTLEYDAASDDDLLDQAGVRGSTLPYDTR